MSELVLDQVDSLAQHFVQHRVRAIAQKPWPVIISFEYPRFRRDALIEFSLMHRSSERNLGKKTTFACDSPHPLQQLDRLLGQRHNVVVTHFHFVAGDAPFGRIEINF